MDMTHSPVGYWQTIDDLTGKPKSILQISDSSGVLSGTVIKIFPKAGEDQNKRCSACTGEKHNQRIVGMVVMEGLKNQPRQINQWDSGQILDPSNGKTYHCQIQLTDKGKKLIVRGYIGLPLFGRSQTWLRMANLENIEKMS
jgi:uncharacterized protein (DUF2147 family)